MTVKIRSDGFGHLVAVKREVNETVLCSFYFFNQNYAIIAQQHCFNLILATSVG